jgi:hypothetical protein
MTQNSIMASPGAYQPIFGGWEDVFLAKFDGEGQRHWGTYYGGTSAESAPSCATDHYDHVYLSGVTRSINKPSLITDPCRRDPHANHIATPGSHQFDYMGWGDAFLVKFADCWSPDTASQIYGPDSLCVNTTGINFFIDPIYSATGYH